MDGRQMMSIQILVLAWAIVAVPESWPDDPPLIEIYEVSDLLSKPRDFSAPRMGLAGVAPDPPADVQPAMALEQLVNLIQSSIDPGVWKDGRNRIEAKEGKLIVKANVAIQGRIAKRLESMRKLAALTYTTEIRILPIDTEGLETLGFAPSAARRSLVLDAEDASAWIAAQPKKPTISKMTTHEGQKSHYLMIDQSAYIADAVPDEQTGTFDPRIEILIEGFVFEITARKRGENQTLLTWKLIVSKAVEPREFVKIGEKIEIELPEFVTHTVEGRSLLVPGKFLAIRATSGIAEIDGEAIVLITAAATDGDLPK